MYLDVFTIPNHNDVHTAESADIGMDVGKWADDKILNNALGEVIDVDYLSCNIGYGCCGEIYFRPIDFKQAIKWVKDNIQTDRGNHLIKILTVMELDNDLYFNYS